MMLEIRLQRFSVVSESKYGISAFSALPRIAKANHRV